MQESNEALIFLLAILAIILLPIYISKSEPKEKTPKNNKTFSSLDNTNSEPFGPLDLTDDKIIEQSVLTDFHGKYQKRYLLSKNEYHEYKKLRYYAAQRNLIVCPKVRLLDIIEPIKGEKYKALLYKIQSKHVDFVICDTNLYIKGILEIDDNSHDQLDRKERDVFVDTILRDVGYKVARTKGITETTLDEICGPITPAQPIGDTK